MSFDTFPNASLWAKVKNTSYFRLNKQRKWAKLRILWNRWIGFVKNDKNKKRSACHVKKTEIKKIKRRKYSVLKESKILYKNNYNSDEGVGLIKLWKIFPCNLEKLFTVKLLFVKPCEILDFMVIISALFPGWEKCAK